jgi:hypothetical protein
MNAFHPSRWWVGRGPLRLYREHPFEAKIQIIVASFASEILTPLFKTVKISTATLPNANLATSFGSVCMQITRAVLDVFSLMTS